MGWTAWMAAIRAGWGTRQREPTDARVLVVSTAVLMLGAFGATLGPALRAARAQPAQALRAG